MRVVLAEDLHLLRTGLTRLLTDYGFEVIAAVETGAELLQALLELRPDVAVVDVRLPPTFTDEGLQAALAARAEIPSLPIVVLSQHIEQIYARELIASGGGAVGYLLKDRVFSDDDFVTAIQRVANGGSAMDPEVITKLVAGSMRHEPTATLTSRELEVLHAMAQGHSNSAISRQLFLSESAVAKHTARIFTKLGLEPTDDSNRRVLAVLAYLNGLRQT